MIKTGFLPPVIFMGVGALTDFGPLLRNLRLSIFGAAAQLGIFTVLLCADEDAALISAVDNGLIIPVNQYVENMENIQKYTYPQAFEAAKIARRKRPQEQGRQQTELQKRKKWHKPFPFRAHNIR